MADKEKKVSNKPAEVEEKTGKVSRRGFLKGTGLVVCGAAAGIYANNKLIGNKIDSKNIEIGLQKKVSNYYHTVKKNLNAKESILFSPFKIRGMTLKNRIVMTPMHTGYANTGGSVSDLLLDHYRMIAKSGVGLVEVEYSSVTADGGEWPFTVRADDEKFLPGLTKLAKVIHDEGVPAILQINHTGRYALGHEGVFSRLVHPLPRISSSPIKTWGVKPKEMTKDDIKNIVKAYAESAKIVKQAGFDAVEVHGGTGYLISQFISPYVNQRKDEYGGSIKNRMRFPLEIVDAVMAEVGEDFPVGYRFMADEGKGLPEGLHLDESSLIAEELEKRGIAYLSVVAGGYDAFGTTEWQEFDKIEAYMVPYAEEIKKVAPKTPIITAGRIQTPATAIRILEEGKADLIGLARILFTDPLWVKKAEGTVKEPIVNCDPDCYVCKVRLKKVRPAICIRWPKERLDTILAHLGEKPDDVYNYLGKPF